MTLLMQVEKPVSVCPTCGQHIPNTPSPADDLLRLLRQSKPHRQVYEGQDGGWYVSYGGGRTTRQAVDELVARGVIVRCYSDSDGMYHVGKTLDVEATTRERKRLGNRTARVYL